MTSDAAQERRPGTTARLLVAFAVVAPPLSWTLHLLVGYGWEEYACSRGEAIGATRPLLAAVTVALALLAGAAGVAGWATWKQARDGALFDPRGRVRFLGTVGMLASGIFALLVLLGGLQLLFLDPCTR